MYKPLAILALAGTVLASCGGNGPLLRDLTRDTNEATRILDARAKEFFPDGTPWPVFAEALDDEGFDLLGEELVPGLPVMRDVEGRRRATAQYDYNFVCGFFANLRWEQRDGAVYNIEGQAFSGCL